MARNERLTIEDTDRLSLIAKALSNKERLAIVKSLINSSLNISEIASQLHIPQSTAALHLKVLEEAGIIQSELLPGERGTMKLCTRCMDKLEINLAEGKRKHFSTSISMPVGAFTNCDIHPTCGMCSANEIIRCDNSPSEFFIPERMNAELIWTSSGFIEYSFPIPVEGLMKKPKRLIFSFEASSEAPFYNEDWPSDITIWINDIEAVTFTCPGDYGKRRGRITPMWWNASQFGLLYTLELTNVGTILNRVRQNEKDIDSYGIDKQTNAIKIRIGNKDDAANKRGFNLYGKRFGDYEQDLVLSLVFD